MIRVVLVDDQSLVRAGLRSLVEHDPALCVVAEAGDGEQALQVVREQLPDVVLMDIRMPGVDGLSALRRITASAELVAVRVIVLTTYELDEYLFEALSLGASGFLLKTVEPDELRRAIHIVANGQALLDPAVTVRVIERFGRGPERGQNGSVRLAELTERERDVVALVGQGMSNDEIGRALYISIHTVKTHLNRAMAKLGARDRAQVVVLAYQTGLVR
jgi:DNA-binding NarL/FixJ family response regulator